MNNNSHWKCARAHSDCSPAEFVNSVIEVTIAESRNPESQMKHMQENFDLLAYKEIILFLSLPPRYFGDYAQAAQGNWGKHGKLHLVAEKPFGTSVEDATELYDNMLRSKIDSNNIHLIDHFLALWMMRTAADMKRIAMSKLNVTWDSRSFSQVRIVQAESRGVDGRGAFFDTVGQARDMVQSHLLQVMAATLAP